MYCRFPTLMPGPSQPRKFAQWFIHDGKMAAEEEAQGRIDVHRKTKNYNPKIVLELQEMLHRENVLVKDFKMIAHEFPQDKNNSDRTVTE